MVTARRAFALAALLSPLVVWSCTDADLVAPEAESPVEILGGIVADVVLDQKPGFYFLPPLADGNPRTEGDFAPGFRPEVRVCDIGPDPVTGYSPGESCVSAPVTVFEPGEAIVDLEAEQYFWSWDTGTRPGGNFFGGNATSNYFELQVVVGNVVRGSLILDPQRPNGPGQSDYPDLVHAFRVGETIPLKVFMNDDLLCDPTAPEVIQCTTGTVVDDTGGLFYLPGPPIVAVRIEANSSATSEYNIVLELLDTDELVDGCIPLLDAWLLGACFRVTTLPEVEFFENLEATVSICVDPTALELSDGTPITEAQQRSLQMIRFSDGDYFALEATLDDCDAVTNLLLAQSGLALASTQMAFGLDDEDSDDSPSDEVGIRLGGLASSFSNFSLALNGAVLELSGVDGSTVSALSPGSDPGPDPQVTVDIQVVDLLAQTDGTVDTVPIPDATVRVSTPDGSTNLSELTTDAGGFATVDWTVDDTTLGEKKLIFESRGILFRSDPDQTVTEPIELAQDTITVTVLGPPAKFGSVTPTPPTLPGGTVNEEAGDVTVTVLDENNQPIPGATVEWGGDGVVKICTVDEGGTKTCGDAETSTTTGPDGTTTVTWFYGTTSGTQTITASLPGTSAEAEFTGEAEAGTPTQLLVSPTSSTGLVGQALDLSVDVLRDEYNNDVSGADLTWSVLTTGGGSITNASDTTDASGQASATWNLGLGSLTAQVAVDGTALVGTFVATTTCFDGYGTATIDGAATGSEWACADSVTNVEVNLGGGSTTAVLKTMNDGDNAYFLLRVPQGTGSDVFSLRFDFDNTGDGTSGDDDVVGYDADVMAAYDGYLSDRCVNRSQSKCFASDGAGGQDVAAAVVNAAGWTTYELSHPLNSGDEFDFDAVNNASIPFFLTLSNGGGAKGNSQYPAFRDFTVLSFSAVAAPGN
jgi:hypothetical protein